MEGARWDEKAQVLLLVCALFTGHSANLRCEQSIDESRPKELFAKMPIILIKAVSFLLFETTDILPLHRDSDIFTSDTIPCSPSVVNT
jgi:hypothetical protein